MGVSTFMWNSMGLQAGLAVLAIFTINTGLGQNCFDSPGSRGPCRAAFPKWTFAQGSCKQFLYGGCRGNGNRFDTQPQCQAFCGQGGGGSGGGGGGGGSQGATRGTSRFVSPCNQ